MPTVLSLPEQRVVLRAVSWETYEKLLADHVDASAPRFTFDHGVLEIMSPFAEHEKCNRTLAMVVEVFAEELGIDIENLGSTTFKRRAFQRGFEADSCFYIQSAELMSGKDPIDPEVDPPPDLAIEIDITRSALSKFPIYGQFGVPEIWRYDGTRVDIFKLVGREYVKSETSVAFPTLTSAALSQLLQESKLLKRPAWLRMLRSWARENLKSSI